MINLYHLQASTPSKYMFCNKWGPCGKQTSVIVERPAQGDVNWSQQSKSAKFQVALSCRDKAAKLPNNKVVAEVWLQYIKQKLLKDPAVHTAYTNMITAISRRVLLHRSTHLVAFTEAVVAVRLHQMIVTELDINI